MYVCVYMKLCMFVYLCVHMRMCMLLIFGCHKHIHKHIHKLTHMHIHAHMYTCMYTHTYPHRTHSFEVHGRVLCLLNQMFHTFDSKCGACTPHMYGMLLVKEHFLNSRWHLKCFVFLQGNLK